MQSSSRSRACCIASLTAIIASGLILGNLSGIDLAQADATASPTASQSMENQGEGVTPGIPSSTQTPSIAPSPTETQKLDSPIQTTPSPAFPSPTSQGSASPAPSTRSTSSCPNNQCSVTFDTTQADTATPDSQTVLSGGLAKRPTDPTRKGYLFDGWFIGQVAYDFNQPVTSSLKLTAKWTAGDGHWSLTPAHGAISGGTTVTVAPPASRGIKFSQITSGSTLSLALGSDGNIYSWGDNGTGHLGDGTNTTRLTPVKVKKPANASKGFIFTKVDAGDHSALAMGSDGNIYTWGLNSSGQLGDGTTENRNRPAPVKKPDGAAPGFTWKQANTRWDHTVALGSDGNLYAWGLNAYGQLGNTSVPRGPNNPAAYSTKPVPVSKPAGITFTQPATGRYSSMAMGSDGKLYAWGWNSNGRLGDGTTTDRLAPTQVLQPNGVTFSQFNVGADYSFAITTNGDLYGWGWNDSGRLGDGTTTDRHVPTLIPRPDGTPAGFTWKQVMGRDYHGMGIGSDGNLYTWGVNWYGDLGLPDVPTGQTSYITRPRPVKKPRPSVPGQETSWVQIYAGWEQSLALGSDGNLYTWGWNCGGQLGDPTIPTGFDNNKAMRLTPGLAAFPLTPDLTAVKFDQTLGSNLKKAGTNWQVVTPAHRKGRVDTTITWNLYGPQPDDVLDYNYDPPSYTVLFDKADGSQPTSQSVVEDQTASRPDQNPTRPGFLFDGWFSGDAAYDFASPVKGSLKLTAHWTAGSGRWTTSPKQGPDSGQTKVTLVPPAARGIRFSQVSAGDDHSLALGSDGNIYAWGANKYGQLGDGTTTERLTPVQISKPTGVNRFIQVSAGKAFSVALDGQGHIWAWGLNSSGQLGSNAVATNGSAAYSSNPIRVQAPSGMTATNFTLTGVSAGITHVLAVDEQGRAWGWGSNEFGKLGVPSSTVATTGITTRPVQVATPKGETTGFRYAQVSAGGSHSLATDAQGRTWGWGSNQNGDLGNTSDVALNGYTFTPVQVKPGTNPTGGFKPVQIIAGSGHSSALDDLGRLWSWGGNSNGELGLGDTTTRTAPSLVAMPANVSIFTQLTGSRASGNSLALDQNGNIWGWGQNSSGMLGTGGTGSLNKPTRLGNPSGIDHFVKISAGTGHTLAIASTGSSMGWGDNGQGRLGNNATQTVYSPVNVLFPFRLGTPSTVQFGGVSGTTLSFTGQQDGTWTVLTPNHQAGDTTVSIAWTLNGAPQPNDETNAFRFVHYGILPLTGEAGILVIIMVGSLAAVSGLAAKRQRLEAQSGQDGKAVARHKH